ncbi:MAG: hypothetical protein ACREMF_02205 [Gemmatimonadales bacterium]
MPEEPNAILPSRLARWIVLVLLVVTGVVLYFRDGVRLPPFGSVTPAAATDSIP